MMRPEFIEPPRHHPVEEGFLNHQDTKSTKVRERKTKIGERMNLLFWPWTLVS